MAELDTTDPAALRKDLAAVLEMYKKDVLGGFDKPDDNDDMAKKMHKRNVHDDDDDKPDDDDAEPDDDDDEPDDEKTKSTSKTFTGKKCASNTACGSGKCIGGKCKGAN